jgi:hypothetical protein
MTVKRGTWPFYSVALAALLSGNTTTWRATRWVSWMLSA